MQVSNGVIAPIKLKVLMMIIRLCIPACGAGRPASSCTIGSLQTHTKQTINNDTETY